MTAEEKTCSSFSGPSEQASAYRIERDTLFLGTTNAFDFPKVAKSFEEQFGESVQWGCITNDGQFTPSPWTPY
jgi:hypothetical protein